jgi:hypothetical protein
MESKGSLLCSQDPAPCPYLEVRWIQPIPQPSFLGPFAKLRKSTISFMSVRLSAWNSATTEWIVMKFRIWAFFENLPRKLEFR